MDGNSPKERRAIARKPGNTVEPVRLCLEEGETFARVHDISVAGIGILTRQRLEPGTWLVLEPAEPSRCLSTELKAEVRHPRKCEKEEESYPVGCRFPRFLTVEDMMALG